MSKEIEEFYKQYSARITEIDDTPLFATGTFGEFRMLTIEEYEKLVRENKILAKALELACEHIKEDLKCDDTQDEIYNYFKTQAKEILENE